jgi:hypothetical protein
MGVWPPGSDNPTARTKQLELRCTECRASSGPDTSGWRGYRWDEPYTDDPPAVAFYCPDCAEREFG